MAECEAGMRLHDFADGSMAYLACDLEAGKAHAGRAHHDDVYGIWWSPCGLSEHGHAGTDPAGVPSPGTGPKEGGE